MSRGLFYIEETRVLVLTENGLTIILVLCLGSCGKEDPTQQVIELCAPELVTRVSSSRISWVRHKTTVVVITSVLFLRPTTLRVWTEDGAVVLLVCILT